MRAAGWSNANTFATFYNKPVVVAAEYCQSLLSSVK